MCSESQCKGKVDQMAKPFLKVRKHQALKMSNTEKERSFGKSRKILKLLHL